MMKKTFTFTITILCLFFLVSCGENKSETTEQKDTVAKQDTVANHDAVAADATNSNVTAAPDEAAIRKFLHSTDGTYGWQTKADKIMLDFFEDGRLAIQGPDGEATMWEGTWKLQGDQLEMKREDLKKTITVTAKIEGDKLVLGDKTYTRYKP